MIHRRTRTAFSIVAVGLLLAGCTSGGTASPADVVQVSMTDDLRFEPVEFTVPTGETVRFEVTNAREIVHELLIGDEAAQEEFEMEMAEGGELPAGCHEPGHYDRGMVATISVQG